MSHTPSFRRFTPLAALLPCVALGSCASVPTSGAFPPDVDSPPAVEREFRGVWVASVANLDWPSAPGLSVDAQKAELIALLDRARELRMNVVILQVRPAADALYPSALEPWSEWLTGEQGRAPEPLYDPLQLAVEEAHARGLELHAWFNPYRAWHPGLRGAAAASHISRARPDLVRSYGSYLWMDPGEEAVRQRSLDVVLDVVRRYDVDGVHIDFYPYRETGADGREIDFPDSVSYARYRAAGGQLDRSHWRRANVDTFVAELYRAVKAAKPWVKVGISPIGTWRPGVAPQLGGFDAYESIYADARKWVLDGSLDYLAPQLYWPIARTDMSFPVLLDWWVRQNRHGRGMYAGLIPSNVNLDVGPRAGWSPDEIVGQIYITRGRPGAEGHVLFRMGDLMPGRALRTIGGADTLGQVRVDSIRAVQRGVQARRDTLALRLRDEVYARPALVPAATWLDDTPPPPPVPSADAAAVSTPIRWRAGAGEPAFLWVVQSRSGGVWRVDILPAHISEWTPSIGTPDVVWLSAVDRVGNLSRAVRVR